MAALSASALANSDAYVSTAKQKSKKWPRSLKKLANSNKLQKSFNCKFVEEALGKATKIINKTKLFFSPFADKV